MNNIFTKLLIFSLIVTISTSCFKEENEPYPLNPFSGGTGSTENSIYSHQSFYSLDENIEVSSNTNSSWDLGFEGSVNGEHVILNSADVLYIANIGAVDFTNTTTIPNNTDWFYDVSTGNFDSLAINGWVNTEVIPYEYSQNVYIVAQKKGITYTPIKKFKLIELTNIHYKIVIDVIENSIPDTVIIPKNDQLNFVKVTTRNKTEVVTIEPNNAVWDIQFTQYGSIIPDDNGVLTPYHLRGAYINPNKIKVAIYYITTDEVPENSDSKTEDDELQAYFEDYFNITPLHDSLYSLNWDAIGYKWKAVTIDENANTAVYKANMRYVYLIKDIQNGKNFKLQFFSYKNQEGVKGYPWFEYIEM